MESTYKNETEHQLRQAKLIETLSASITSKLVSDIANGKIPLEWDGYELRQLLADRFARAIVKMTKRRKAEYNNTVLVNNL